jgi:hypothetical protein
MGIGCIGFSRMATGSNFLSHVDGPHGETAATDLVSPELGASPAIIGANESQTRNSGSCVLARCLDSDTCRRSRNLLVESIDKTCTRCHLRFASSVGLAEGFRGSFRGPDMCACFGRIRVLPGNPGAWHFVQPRARGRPDHVAVAVDGFGGSRPDILLVRSLDPFFKAQPRTCAHFAFVGASHLLCDSKIPSSGGQRLSALVSTITRTS